MKATPEDVAKRITPVTRGVPSGFASMKATPEDVAKTARLAALLTWACVASMKATPEDVAKRSTSISSSTMGSGLNEGHARRRGEALVRVNGKAWRMASMKATPEDVAKALCRLRLTFRRICLNEGHARRRGEDERQQHDHTHRSNASMKATPEDVAKRRRTEFGVDGVDRPQ